MKSQQNIWRGLCAIIAPIFSICMIVAQCREQPTQKTSVALTDVKPPAAYGLLSSSPTQATGSSSEPLTWTLKPSPQPAQATLSNKSQEHPLSPATLAWILEHKDHWPQEVTLREEATFPIFYNGARVGSTKFPAGKKVTLVKIEQEHLTASFNGGTQQLSIGATDLPQQIQAVIAKAAAEASTTFDPDKYLADAKQKESGAPRINPSSGAAPAAKSKITFLDREAPIRGPETDRPNVYEDIEAKTQREHLKALNDDLKSSIADLKAWFFPKRTKVENYEIIAKTILAITRSSHGKQTPFTGISSWGLSEGDVMGIRDACSALGSINRLESQISFLEFKTDLTKFAAEQASSAAQLASHEAAYAREAANRASSHALDASMNAMEASLNSQQASSDAEQASMDSQNASRAVEGAVWQLRNQR